MSILKQSGSFIGQLVIRSCICRGETEQMDSMDRQAFQGLRVNAELLEQLEIKGPLEIE